MDYLMLHEPLNGLVTKIYKSNRKEQTLFTKI